MPVTLASLAATLPGVLHHGGQVALDDVTHDSRQAGPGVLFAAVPGQRSDGHDHAADAVTAGTPALLVERVLPLAVPQLVVPEVRAALGPAAALVHGEPSRELTIVGVTGTNGKTTVTALLDAAFRAAGHGTGTIGTIAPTIRGERQPGGRTTPEGTDLQRLLRRMVTAGVSHVAMEVSSHGLDLRRVDGTRFAVGVFTNLSQDHLDWHGSMEAYLEAKLRLFTPGLIDQGVVHVGDRYGTQVAHRAAVPVTTVGTGPDVDVRITDVGIDLQGGRATLLLPDGPLSVTTPLLGGFNLANAAVAVVAAIAAGIAADTAAAGVAAAGIVPGRLERVATSHPATIVVDYAHTPDAVAQVIAALRALTVAGGRVVVVLGAGGDRDRGKRGAMGAAAATADVAVLTTDNPRSEDPATILAAVLAGAREAVAAGAPAIVHQQLDRRAAIAAALTEAGSGDVVVIAGKGHEAVQELADGVVPFDDRLVAAELAAQQAPRP